MKPLYYFLAKHGPWDFHVEIFGAINYLKLIDHLTEIGKRNNIDYEVIENVSTRKSDRNLDQMNRPHQTFIFLFRDRSLFTQIKLTYG